MTPSGFLCPEGPCGGTPRDRGHLLICKSGTLEGRTGSDRAITPQARSLAQGVSSEKVLAPLGLSRRDPGRGPSLSPRPPQLSRAAAGQEVGGRGRRLGRGEGPGQRAGPAPSPPHPWPRPPPPSAPGAPRRGAAESERRARSAEPARGLTKRRRLGRPGPDAQSDRPTGPLSRAGQERQRPRGAQSAECGARRGGSLSAAAAGCVEPGPGPAGTCVCERGTRALPSAHPAAARGRERRPGGKPEEEEEEEEGALGGAAGTRGCPREAPPRPLSPARAGGMPRGRRTLARALP